MTTGKSTALTIRTFVSRVMSLLFNMLSRWTGGNTSWNQDCWEKYQLKYADDTTLMAESEEGTKEPLDERERGE